MDTRTQVTLEPGGPGEQPQLRFQRHYPQPGARLWQALEDDAEFSAWFGINRRAPRLAAGEPIELSFPGGEAEPGRLLAVHRPWLLAFTWQRERLRFRIGGGDQGSVLSFTTTVEDPGHIAHSAAGYALSMEELAVVLGSPAAPTPSFDELVGTFTRRWGLTG